MFALIAALALTGAHAAPVAQRDQPDNWATGYLESYDTYHTRYLALNCQNQHDTQFFDTCCHPLLSTETLASRPNYCTPTPGALASASASATDSDSDASSDYAQATSSVESVYQSVEATATATNTAWTSALAATSTLSAAAQFANPTTSSAQPTKTKSSGGGGSSSGTMTGGYATYFYQNGNAGECGTVHSDSEYGIAIDSNGWWQDYASNDNSPYCGKWITITNTQNGNSVMAQVWDVCPTCTTDNSLDLSVAAFEALAPLSDGQIPITWSFN